MFVDLVQIGRFSNQVRAAVCAVAPGSNVSIHDQGDKSTWTIEFADGTTDDQKAAAQTVVENFVFQPPKTDMEILLAALQAKGIAITQQDLDAVK